MVPTEEEGSEVCDGGTAIVPAVREWGHNNDNGQKPGLTLQLRCGHPFNIPTG